jgi:hypothetical protein
LNGAILKMNQRVFKMFIVTPLLGFFLPQCASRKTQQSSESKGIFNRNKIPLPERPQNFLTAAPETFDKSKCQFEEPEEGSPLGKVAEVAGKKYKIVRSDYAPFCLPLFNKNNGFPDHLQGIWWMNGNPIPEILLTFANTKWDNEKKISYLKPNDPFSWTWVANGVLGKTFLGTGKTNSTIEISFDKDNLDEIQKMISGDTLENGDFKINSDFLWKYTLIDPQANPNEAKKMYISGAKKVFDDPTTIGSDALIRRTKWLGAVTGDYTLTRIVNGDGKILKDNYSVYLSFLEEKKHYYSGVLVDDLFPKQ